jgi:ribonuclease VapC
VTVVFVDASAIVAILSEEPDAAIFEAVLLSHRGRRSTSPISLFEAALALIRKGARHADATRQVHDWVLAAEIAVPPLTLEILEPAVEAHYRFGRRSGHSAKLNLGDCLAYAAAKHLDAPLLFKGDDFSKTDIVSAIDHADF